MSAWQEAVLIVGMMVVTFGVRYPILALSGRLSLPKPLEEALAFVPVAVLTAISVPILVKPHGAYWLSIQNEYLMAGLASVVIVLVSRHLLLTIALGMAVFLVLRFL